MDDFDAVLQIGDQEPMVGSTLDGVIFNDKKRRFKDKVLITTSKVVAIAGDVVATRNSVYKVIK